ncbi:SR-related and CTD-associated factor 4-like isoform 2-T2 [Pholidichthys leucotaenia]
MDAVNAFNMELFSMIDMKPPISRAKMMSVTKSAIKAIKLYKHVVQIVEKFIKKCKPELKVPGLYVVDSIVRQSRHQFGVDKDVFGPRFLKNFTDTFQNLYHCPDDDKTKIIRVLNLWQKNGVFEMDVLKPLMDMADGLVAPPPVVEVPADPLPEPQPPVVLAEVVPAVPQLPTPDALAAVAQLFQSPHGQELQRMLQSFQQADLTPTAGTENDVLNVPNPPQMPMAQQNESTAHTEEKSSLAEKLLDRFDYDDEPEDATVSEGNIQSQVGPENAFNQLNTDPHAMGRTENVKLTGAVSHGEPRISPDAYQSGVTNETCSRSRENSRDDSSVRREGRHRGHGRRSRSGSRSPRRRRSRSSSRSRTSRHHRSRSRSRDRRRKSHSQDRDEREKDRERRQKGLPGIKSQSLSVCSTTLWVGQLDKKTQQSDVMSLLEEFGQIESINMIPPRGCAYIVMVHRQDAYTALKKLSRGSFKVNQKPIKIAWALNKGIKSAHKKFWDVERGVTYIPWSKVKVEELQSYREGGMLDAETLNSEWTNAMDLNSQPTVNGVLEGVSDGAITAQIQLPPVQQTEAIGSPPAFPGPIMLSPPSMPPSIVPFMPPEFDPAKLAAGSVKPPEEFTQDSKGDAVPSSDAGPHNQLGSPTPPLMTMPNPAAMPPGPRPGMPPLQPPSMASPHMPPFLPPPNMPHMPPQMMPRAPMYSPDRFGMPMPFPPRGPPFPQHPSMGPNGMNNGEGRPFRHGGPGPGFGYPSFPRGRW